MATPARVNPRAKKSSLRLVAKMKGQTAPKKAKTGNVWLVAVDPYSGVDVRPMWNLVKPLSHFSNSKVQMAYVLGPAGLNWSGEFNGSWLKKYRPIAELELDAYLEGTEAQRVVIPCKESGLRAAVKALTQYSQKVKATCIVIGTHGRTGLERAALGSFTETLILTSKLPVLVVRPGQNVPKSVRKILVPIDFTKQSDQFAESMADYAKTIGSDIVLFHKQSDPLDPIVQQGVYSLGGGWMSVQNYIDEELTAKTNKMLKLELSLTKRGIGVSHIFDSSPGGLIQSIERATKESGADMVSVLTRSGTWSAVLLGSVARGLVRSSSVPVLVQRNIGSVR